jgi:hypothetical protein
MRRRQLLVSALAMLVAARAEGQTAYYNLDAGRPVRIDDATPTERYALDLQLAPLRLERYPGGLLRLRAEPKLSFGVLPLTEIEARLPLVRVMPRDSGLRPTNGIASFGLGVTHALTLEGQHMPALAIGGEWLLPTGALSAPRSSYSYKGLLTKTTTFGRIHLNAGGGTYSVQSAGSDAPGCIPPPAHRVLFPTNITPYCNDTSGVVIVNDLPCSAPKASATIPSCAAEYVGSSVLGAANPATTTGPVASGPPTYGRRTFFGVGLDHTFARQSTLIVADVTTERFIGLYPTRDLVVDVGLRHQLSPWMLVDGGVTRRFHGSAQFTAVTIGATYELSMTGRLGKR